jgi:hypothetical protein
MKINYYRRYQIISGKDFACVVSKHHKGQCIPFTDLENAKTGVDILLSGTREEFYSLDNTKHWRSKE